MHYGSKKEGDWRVKNFEARRHHQQPKKTLPFVKLPSFNGNSDPNVYLGWETRKRRLSKNMVLSF